ncbi:MAG: formyltransferase family protein, partial [Spirochaetota bacterium]|nr:formyltransferase family protein [Spirochaetota bacterium]
SSYYNRVVNIHPALIPAFSGAGFYGDKVYKAVLDYGVKVTGCTVHFVDEEYDHGAIIDQAVVEVLEGDTVETLKERVTAAEREIYPRIIQKIVQNKVRVAGRKVRIF